MSWKLLFGLLLLSLAFNVGAYRALDTQANELNAALYALAQSEREKAQQNQLRAADHAALRALRNAQAEAAREAQEKRDALHLLDTATADALDDAAFCARLGGLWCERAAPPGSADPAGGAP